MLTQFVFVSFWRCVRSCCQAACLSCLHCLSVVDPTKAGAQTPPTSALAPQKHCPSAGLILFRRNSSPTLQTGAERTRSAPTCFVSQGQDLPTTLRDRRPLCETVGIKKKKKKPHLYLFSRKQTCSHTSEALTLHAQIMFFWATPEWTTFAGRVNPDSSSL